ncbi:MAG: imidazole glycerol phosphate synthase subunit HisH [Saprospiraceae bacterium]
MNLTIIDYNAGNTQSVIFALNRLGIEPILTDDFEAIQKADKVIFPGVGEASTTMAFLRKKGLDKLIPSLKQPVLGVCLGMQLMCAHSEENDTTCMGIFEEKVKLFKPVSGEKVPHIGWNNITHLKSGIFDESLENERVYFVHSYYVEQSNYTAAIADYCQPFSAALQKGNFYATQFHPEKSGKVGARIIENFVNL